eukprot:m.76557 g.76557  ORF g.76557 m.76557 type:complete len:80 (+) comp8517_c0_seq4:2283-2522(+)
MVIYLLHMKVCHKASVSMRRACGHLLMAVSVAVKKEGSGVERLLLLNKAKPLLSVQFHTQEETELAKRIHASLTDEEGS